MKKQPTAFEVALAAKQGGKIDGVEIKPENLRGAARQLYQQLSVEELKDYTTPKKEYSKAAERLVPAVTARRRLRRT